VLLVAAVDLTSTAAGPTSLANYPPLPPPSSAASSLAWSQVFGEGSRRGVAPLFFFTLTLTPAATPATPPPLPTALPGYRCFFPAPPRQGHPAAAAAAAATAAAARPPTCPPALTARCSACRPPQAMQQVVIPWGLDWLPKLPQGCAYISVGCMVRRQVP